VRRLRFGFGGLLSNYIDSHTGVVEVEVVTRRDKEWIDNSFLIFPQMWLGKRTWLEVGHWLDIGHEIWRIDR